MEVYCIYENNAGWIELNEKEIIFSSKKLLGEWNKFYITDYYNIKYIDIEKGITTNSLIIETKDKKFAFTGIANSEIGTIKKIIDKRKGNLNYSTKQKIKGIEILKERNMESNKRSNTLIGAGISLFFIVLVFWWLARSCGIL
ncbi:MAG: hypothetical protein A2163_04025 [Actinobacteria bacterium RBG_13_35_12]|nr:MAG: hypothetical protein A2163_04025 [Actinobacteria bacterium RBG_13_35_12]